MKYFNKLGDKRIFQETFYNLSDFEAFQLEETDREHNFLSSVDANQNKVKIYPFLVRMFYANLGGDKPPNNDDDGILWSKFLGIEIVLIFRDLGVILNCSNIGLELDDIGYKHFAYDPVSCLFHTEKIENISVNLWPQALILNKIIVHTILPRTESYKKTYDSNYKILYSIYSNQNLKWARIIHDEIKRFHAHNRHTIFFASYLIKIFFHYGINIDILQAFSPKNNGSKIKIFNEASI